MDGILIVDKPENFTSHDVVARLRRILRTKKIGHTGTLDPFATGVLVMLVGKATRLAQFLDKDRKEYEATIRFGFETDTGDRTGEIRSAKCEQRNVSEDELKNVLKDFRGTIEQLPPMYSAKKIAGKKLYELARKGIEVERKPVKVTIYELEQIENQKPKTENQSSDESGIQNQEFGIKVSCSAGTYIRTLAEDIGKKLNVGAHLAELRRTKAGNFDLSQAVTLEQLEAIVAENKLGEYLISMNAALGDLPKIVLSEAEIRDTQNGKKLKFETEKLEDEKAIKMLDAAENLVAIGFYDKEQNLIQPRIVFV